MLVSLLDLNVLCELIYRYLEFDNFSLGKNCSTLNISKCSFRESGNAATLRGSFYVTVMEWFVGIRDYSNLQVIFV